MGPGGQWGEAGARAAGEAERWTGPGACCCGPQGRERARVGLVWAAGMGWAGAGLSLVLGFAFSISLSLLFLIQTSLNSNKSLNSNHTQLKVCTSMNATLKLNL